MFFPNMHLPPNVSALHMECVTWYNTQYERGMTMIDMKQIISGVTLTKACNVSPDNESKKDGVTKRINVKVKFDGATIGGVFDKALSGTVIQWQNGVGRKAFDTYTDNQTVEITFTAPASKPVEAPEDAFTREAKAAGVDMNDEQALAMYIIKRMTAAKA